jgi:hypothetical protein
LVVSPAINVPIIGYEQLSGIALGVLLSSTVLSATPVSRPGDNVTTGNDSSGDRVTARHDWKTVSRIKPDQAEHRQRWRMIADPEVEQYAEHKARRYRDHGQSTRQAGARPANRHQAKVR